jgi:hypothetical protein
MQGLRLTLAWCLICGLSVAGLSIAGPVAGPAAPAPAFDPTPWLEDLDQARAAFADKYADLEWEVIDRQTDLAALFSGARERIAAVHSDAEARHEFDSLARRFGNRHTHFRWPKEASGAAPTPSVSCAGLGFDRRMLAAPEAALVPGYTALANYSNDEFPAGMLQVAGHRVGVLKIPLFSPQGFPELCESALTELQIARSKTCDDACDDRIEAWGAERMTRDLAAAIRAIRAAGAEVLLVDVAGNGGGSEWEQAAVRMVTSVRIRSARMGFVRGEHWAKHWAGKEAELRAAAAKYSREDRAFLLRLADQVAERRQLAATPCDSGPLWRGERPACPWVGDAFFSSGLLDSDDSGQLRSKPWGKLLYTPATYPYEEGIWNGPLLVLVDGDTGSAAEQFAAELQDNRAALIIGATTVGAGCGHTDGGTPTTLNHSHAVLELPDCVAFRRDGSNLVSGIQPDVLVGLRADDGPRRRGSMLAGKLGEAVKSVLESKR